MDEALSLTFARWRASGDPQLLAQVFDRAAPELLRVAIHLVGEPGAAEDLVQATFVTAIERAQVFDATRKLEAWLAGILANHARDLQREAARAPDPQRFEERMERSALDEALAVELSGEIARALDRLPEPYRRALILRVRHGLAPADIAHVLGESPGTVRVRLHRALELLRKQLPAGLALGGFFALEPARGMSAVKSAVLAHASVHVGVGVAGGIGGVLVTKKLLVALAVLTLFLLAWWQWPVAAPASAGGATGPSTPQLAKEVDGVSKSEALSISPSDELARTRAEPDASPARAQFHLGGRVVDGESGLPLAGAAIELFAAKQLKLSEIKQRWSSELIRDWNGGPNYWSPWPWIASAPDEAQRADRAPMSVCAPPEKGERALASRTTSADGTFDFVASEPQGFLVCRCDGYALRLLPARKSCTSSTVREGRSVDETKAFEGLVVRMYREQHVRGMLIDEKGERVHEKVLLRFTGYQKEVPKESPLDDPHLVGSWTFETAADGSFELDVAAPQAQITECDPRWSVCGSGIHPVRHERYSFGVSYVRGTLQEPIYVVVRRTPVLRVRDHVTHEPIENIRVVARGKINGYPSLCGRYFARHGELRLRREQSLMFEGMGLDEEPMLCSVWADGYAASTVAGSFASNGPDLEVELERGELPMSRGILHHGIAALAGVRVTLAPESKLQWGQESFLLLDTVDTDAQGRFAFRAPEGFYVLRFAVEGAVRSQGVDLPLERTLVIDVGGDASVRVHVQDTTGRARADHVVALQSKTSGVRRLHTDARGDALFEALAAGPCTVMLSNTSTDDSFTADFVREFELAAGERASVEAVIPADDPRFAHLVVAGESDLSSWRAFGPDRPAQKWQPIESDGRIPIDIQKGVQRLEVEHGSLQRWSFSLPRVPPADLVLRIDPKGPAYEVELIDATTHKPLVGAVVVGTPKARVGDDGPAVSAGLDERGVARLTGLSSSSVRLAVRLRTFEPHTGDLMHWDGGGGAVGFEPARPATAEGAHLRIEVPAAKEGHFVDLKEVRLAGDLRIGGQLRKDVWISGVALQSQADGVAELQMSGASTRTDENGRYELRVPLTARVRLLVYDPDAKKSFDPIEWDLDPSRTEQQRDIELP